MKVEFMKETEILKKNQPEMNNSRSQIKNFMKFHHYNGLKGGRMCDLEDKINKLKHSDKLLKRQIGKTVQIEH